MLIPLNKLTEVEAINYILATVGGETVGTVPPMPLQPDGRPVTPLSFTATQAYNSLRDAMRSLMSHSWGFNTEYDFELTSTHDEHLYGPGLIVLDIGGVNPPLGYYGEYVSKIDMSPKNAGNFDVTTGGRPAFKIDTTTHAYLHNPADVETDGTTRYVDYSITAKTGFYMLTLGLSDYQQNYSCLGKHFVSSAYNTGYGT